MADELLEYQISDIAAIEVRRGGSCIGTFFRGVFATEGS